MFIPFCIGTLTGLIGNFDGDPANDLRLPNGTILEPDATEETIFQAFNEPWRVAHTDSLFSYPTGKTYWDYNSQRQIHFLPVFLSSITSSVTPEARELCGNNTNCLYDLYVTGSSSVAEGTLQFTHQLKQAEDAAITVISCPVLPSKDGGVWYSDNTIENATAHFVCSMGYQISRSCPPTTCTNGRWSNFQQCSCDKIPTLAPTSVGETTFTSTSQSRNSPTPTLHVASTLQSTYSPMPVGHQMTSVTTQIPTLKSSPTGQTAISSTLQSQEPLPRTPPPNSQSTHTATSIGHQTTTVTTKDNSDLLTSIFNKVQTMWYIILGGVVIIVFILMTSFVTCCKIRSRKRCAESDSENSSSYRRSSGCQQ